MGGVKRLLIPWLMFVVITYFLFHLYLLPSEGLFDNVKTFVTPIVLTGAPECNVALWYLLTLFFVRILYNKIAIFGITPLTIYTIFTAIVIVLFVLNTNIFFHNFPLYIFNTLTGLSFYAGGAVLKNAQYNKYLLMCTILMYILLMLIDFSFVDMFNNELVVGSFLIWLISSLMGCIIINNIFKGLNNITSFKILSYIGRNSMTFYAAHLLIFCFLSRTVFKVISTEYSYMKLFVAIFVCAISLPLLNILLHSRKLRWIIGEDK